MCTGMSAPSIREAGPQDDALVGELLVEAFVTMYAKKMPMVTVLDERKAELRATAAKRAVAKVWVAELEGRVVGTVTVWPSGSRGSEAFEPGAFDLRHLAVAGDVRGGKVSAALMDHAEAWARTQGASGMCLHVRRGVAGVAALYLARGYLRRPDGDLDLLPHVFLEGYFLPFTR